MQGSQYQPQHSGSKPRCGADLEGEGSVVLRQDDDGHTDGGVVVVEMDDVLVQEADAALAAAAG